MRTYAFIPTRSPYGGSRVGFDKDMTLLDGVPLIVHTVRAAIQSGVFDRVIAVTLNDEVKHVVEKYGAEVPYYRPVTTVSKDSPDIDWVKWVLGTLYGDDDEPDMFSILRTTSPFLRPETIADAALIFKSGLADSLRAVREVTEHPGKMWVVYDHYMHPLLPTLRGYSRPTQSLPKVYIQTAGMEFVWTNVVKATDSIAGNSFMPYILEGPEALDINTLDELREAERIVREGKAWWQN